MFQKTLFLSTAFLASVAALGVAQAEGSANNDYYARLDVGMQQGQKLGGLPNYLKSSTVGYRTAKYRKEVVGQLGIGAYLPNHFRTDATIGFGSYSISASNNSTASKPSTSMKVKNKHLMLNSYYDLVSIKGLVPYVTVGLGFSQNALSSSMMTVAVKKKSGFAWQGGAGIAFHFSNTVALDLSYRHLDLGAVGAKNKLNTALTTSSPAQPPYIQKNPRLSTSQVLLGLRLSF